MEEEDEGVEGLANYLKRRLIVSRKGKLHLGRLVSCWRQSVLSYNERISPSEMILDAWSVDGRLVQNQTQPNRTEPNEPSRERETSWMFDTSGFDSRVNENTRFT